MDRIAALTEILAANPEDSFARYGLAMEYSKAGQIDQALQEFKTLIEKNPDYTPAYFMAAQMLASASRVDEAKRMAGGWHLLRPPHRQRPRPIGDDGHAGRTGMKQVSSQSQVAGLIVRVAAFGIETLRL